ncbi:methyltransferase domain-containing protein [Alteromonas ponticola]|uniref:tRNA 5-carboxymethoxyuridine methyltransferase n=1 Tax=Alteromonas aquimaris TaxID=2998417 RepID=A0ABT3P7K7_9ALTE|nr:methyltransferase [Alteromonas aquimaris]MCW8108525.1 methyltransferase domain-containing protein [Alteromonas aquimaris]
MKEKKSDIHFDGLANKFATNIYGTTKGQLRHKILLYAIESLLRSPPTNVIEIGGGTGLMAKALLEVGHNVVFTDASAEILEHARLNLDGFTNVKFRHQTLEEIDDLSQYDVIICHAVLEWLHSPLEALSHILVKMKAGSQLSLTFFNHDATLFTNAIYGNFDYIARGLKVRNQVRLNPKNPLRPKQVIEHVTNCGLQVEKVTGVRCFHDYMKVKPEGEQEQELLNLEMKYCQEEPFMWMGKYVHLLIKKPLPDNA